jgi:hypothetical protein
MFLTDLRLGTGASRPRQDLQYHWAKSLTNTLLGTGQFFFKAPGTPFLDTKLCGSSLRSEEGRKLKPLSKAVARVEHSHYPLTQGPLLVPFVSFSKARLSFAVHYPPLHEPPVLSRFRSAVRW